MPDACYCNYTYVYAKWNMKNIFNGYVMPLFCLPKIIHVMEYTEHINRLHTKHKNRLLK